MVSRGRYLRATSTVYLQQIYKICSHYNIEKSLSISQCTIRIVFTFFYINTHYSLVCNKYTKKKFLQMNDLDCLKCSTKYCGHFIKLNEK